MFPPASSWPACLVWCWRLFFFFYLICCCSCFFSDSCNSELWRCRWACRPIGTNLTDSVWNHSADWRRGGSKQGEGESRAAPSHRRSKTAVKLWSTKLKVPVWHWLNKYLTLVREVTWFPSCWSGWTKATFAHGDSSAGSSLMTLNIFFFSNLIN